MPETNPQVMDLIESELKKNPDVSNAELLEKAKKIDPGVAEITSRQFNARYPLQVKRAMTRHKPSKRKRRSTNARKPANGRPDGAERANVRNLLLQLAKDVANADGNGDVVDIVAGIDKYVDRVLKAVAK